MSIKGTGTITGPMEPLLSVAQVAEILGRSHWMLRRDIRAGRVAAVRIGRALMIQPAEVRRIMAEGLITGSASGTEPVSVTA